MDAGLTIDGSGFRRYETIDLVFALRATTPVIATIQADDAGSFTVNVPTLGSIRKVHTNASTILSTNVITLRAEGSDVLWPVYLLELLKHLLLHQDQQHLRVQI
jgi:hypothetical protein